MALKIMDLFKSIKWAKNGDVTDMSQTNYEAGWAHLGDDTPTVEDFNLVQKLNDEKDQWLFNQIKSVCDDKNIKITEEDAEALLKAINTSATLSRAGITQLSSALDSTLETMAATPKAIKTLKDLIDSVVLNLNNYIPNSKKSDSVTSSNSDTVATSKAVKDANDNANGRVSKSGDTMTGPLEINAPSAFIRFKRNGENIGFVGAPNTTSENIKLHSYKHDTFFELQAANAYINKALELAGDIAIKSGDYSSVELFNNANKRLIFEVSPDSTSSIGNIIYRNASNVNEAAIGIPRQNGTMALLEDFSHQKIGNFEVRKYPDGTMIQTYILEQQDIIPERQGNPSFNWAVAFRELPLVMGNITTSINSGHDTGINILSSSTNAAVFYYVYEHGNINQGLCRLQFIGIGKWK